MSEEELRQRLVELGQWPYLAGAPIWNLDKVKTLGDLAAFQKGGADYDDGATGSESLEGLSSPCLRRTDWPEPEMRTLLKRCVYIVEAGQYFAAIDKHTAGSYATRVPLYPGWGTGAGSSPPTADVGYWSAGPALDRAGMLKMIADLADVASGNMSIQWSIPSSDLLAGQLDAAQYSDDTVRIVCRELVYFKQTTIPGMWESKAGGAEKEFDNPQFETPA